MCLFFLAQSAIAAAQRSLAEMSPKLDVSPGVVPVPAALSANKHRHCKECVQEAAGVKETEEKESMQCDSKETEKKESDQPKPKETVDSKGSLKEGKESKSEEGGNSENDTSEDKTNNGRNSRKHYGSHTFFFINIFEIPVSTTSTASLSEIPVSKSGKPSAEAPSVSAGDIEIQELKQRLLDTEKAMEHIIAHMASIGQVMPPVPGVPNVS